MNIARDPQYLINRLIAWAVLLFAAIWVPQGVAQTTTTWQGTAGGGSTNWSKPNNFSTTPINNSTYNFIFATSSRLGNGNDLTGLTANSILFTNTAGAFVLGGNSLTLSGGITNVSSNIQTMNLNLNLSATATIATTSNNITLGGVVSGADFGITKTGTNILTLTATNTFTGTTTVNAGTLSLSTNGTLSGTTNVLVNGGTLLLGGSNSINTSANLTLGGGTLSLGAGTTRAAAQTFNTLTLTANSIIDFANLSGKSSLTFSSISGLTGSSKLSIYDWNGTNAYGFVSTTGGAGQTTGLNDLSGLTQAQLNNISFYSGVGTGFLGTGVFSGNQIIPVPEPSIVISALLLLAFLLLPKSFIAKYLTVFQRTLNSPLDR